MIVTALLEIKAEYDSVSKKKLYEVVKTSQNDQVVSVVRFALQPVTVTTQAEKSEK